MILRTKGTIAKESQNYLREKNDIQGFWFVNAIFNYLRKCTNNHFEIRCVGKIKNGLKLNHYVWRIYTVASIDCIISVPFKVSNIYLVSNSYLQWTTYFDYFQASWNFFWFPIQTIHGFHLLPMIHISWGFLGTSFLLCLLSEIIPIRGYSSQKEWNTEEWLMVKVCSKGFAIFTGVILTKNEVFLFYFKKN